MTTEFITATMAAMEGFLALRAGNPNHVSSGEKGGQFTSGGGSGGGHGKHWAQRQRRKKKLLAKLKHEGHAKIAKVREKQRGERKAIREKHRRSDTPYKERRGETKSLATKHTAERQETIKELKASVRKEVESLKVAKPAGQSKSEKLKEFQTKREKANKIFNEMGKEDLQKNAVRHAAERKQVVSGLKSERAEIRGKMATERTDTLNSLKSDYKDDRKIAIMYAADGKKQEAIQQNKEFYAKHIKDTMTDLRQTQRDQLEDHREHAKMVIDKMDRAHLRENLVVTKLYNKSRRMILEKLKKQLEERSYGRVDGSIGGIQRLHIDGRPRSVSPDGQRSRESVASVGRFGPMATHKASSSQSILKHCLRQHPGWSKRWREGQLTGRQHLTLLMDVRQYGRAWLRHEMGGFFDAYGGRSQALGENGAQEGFGRSGTLGDSAGVLASLEPRSASEIDVTRTLASVLLSPLRRTFDRMRIFVRELIHAAGEAIAGPGMSMDDYTFLDQQANKQDDYLDVFRKEMEANPPREIATPEPIGMPSQTILVQEPPRSPAQITARAELYGNSAWQAGQRLNRSKARRIEGLYERRLMGKPKTEHCTDCPPLAALGWQPVGTLPDIGDSECGSLCLCHFEYSMRPDESGATKVPGKPPETTRPKGGGQAPVVVAPIKANPTPEEIDAEFKKWKEGKPSAIAIKDAVKPPAHSTEQEEQEFELPPGYEWSSE